MTTTVLLEAKGLSLTLGTVSICKALDLEIQAGQSWGILGPNGAGKTTLLRALAGLQPTDQGALRLNGHALNRLSRRQVARQLGMLSQHTEFVFEASCEETALVGRHPHLGSWGHESPRDRQLACQALDCLGLGGLAERSCMQLSGGEKRRLAMARLLVQDPAVMLLDEPSNHLDPSHQIMILDEVYRRVRQGERAAVMALHEINLASCYCSHILMLFGDGQWEAGPTAELLEAGRLSRLYGCTIRLVDDGEQRVFAVAARGREASD
ncbi:MAG: ABC transporter ATP-binding protein [Wenzhouxiangella sp.]